MADKEPQRPLRSDELFRKPPAVEYIDKKLGDIHLAFKSPPVHFDETSSSYVPDAQQLIMQLRSQHSAGVSLTRPTQTSLAQDVAVNTESFSTALTNELPTRPEYTEISAMRYWKLILPAAIAKFSKHVPEIKKLDAKFSIRNKTDWNQIYGTLNEAQSVYLGSAGKGERMRRMRRKAVDKVAAPMSNVAGIASKMMPEDPYTTPVLGTVEVLIDALKYASEIRAKSLAAFDDLVSIFADIELFLATFPRDGNIMTASTDLVVAVLTAIEKVIAFFLSESAKRTVMAIFTGKDYEKSLMESLDDIKIKSAELIQEGLKSHIFKVHMCSQETRKLLERFFERQSKISDNFNNILELFLEYVKRLDVLLAKEHELSNNLIAVNQQQNAVNQQQIAYLQAQTEHLHSHPTHTFVLYQSFVMPPYEVGWVMTPEMWRDIFKAHDIDLKDIAYIRERAEMLSTSERATAEQIVSNNLFRSWILSTSSSKLLIEWQSARTVGDISPLTNFCTTLALMLQTNQRFLPLFWSCGLHSDLNVTTERGASAMVRSLIDQLLRWGALDLNPLQQSVASLPELSAWDLDQMIIMLGTLLRLVPRMVTVLFIVDGLVYFERDEFAQTAVPLLGQIVSLADGAVREEQNMAATVKVLFASCPSTHLVREWFEEEELILNVGTMPKLNWAPSEERMRREMGGI